MFNGEWKITKDGLGEYTKTAKSILYYKCFFITLFVTPFSQIAEMTSRDSSLGLIGK